MLPAVYALCALTSLLCAVLLVRSYRQSGSRLLLWSAIGFSGLFANNLLIFVDVVFIPEVELALFRAIVGTLSIGLLVWGLIGVSVGKGQR